MNIRLRRFLLPVIIITAAGCANITAPTGGKKDTIPPKLVSVDPPDSLLNTRVSKIELYFDKYITVTDPGKEVQLSPIITIQPTVKAVNKRVIVKIVDSLEEDNTTYRLTFGNAIKDVHEGNVFAKYVYTFSTGPYFDSLTLKGSVIDAATGLPDTGTVYVELYSAKDNDSAVVRHKPKYVIKVDASGKFEFKGLPKRIFSIYALKDANGNLVYDGIGEKIAFKEVAVTPGDTLQPSIQLRLFTEILDTGLKKTDTLGVNKNINKKAKQAPAATYTVNIDSTNANKRTFDINGFIKMSFNTLPLLNRGKIRLSYDSMGVEIPVPISMAPDTLHPNEFHILPAEDSIFPKQLHTAGLSWQQNTVYTFRLSKGFSKDTSGVEFSPSRYVFRTKDEDDYGIITVHLPTKYYAEIEKEKSLSAARAPRDTIPDFILLVTTDKDTVYSKKVTDTMVVLTRLSPAKYSFRIIIDKNKNGKWDTGDLFGKRQPEDVVPYRETLEVKAGWVYTIDFEQKPVKSNK